MSQQLYERAKEIIPGGTQLLSKRPEQYAPGQWPAYYDKAYGITIESGDRTFLDFTTGGIGACILGFADPDVDHAVLRAISRGSASTLNCPEEVELAELLLHLHPWAGGVRYTRSGGEAMAVAVRIARALTGRSSVVVGGYHGWHDWYQAYQNMPGVPEELSGTVATIGFWQNPLPYKYAAIIVEPSRHVEPPTGQLQALREFADRTGAVLIFDEISSGFRHNLGGKHLHYGVNPDIAVFAKAISNGYPMAAVIGRKDVMAAANKTFISSTSWTERIGPTAALATIQKLWADDVHKHILDIGFVFKQQMTYLLQTYNLGITVDGLPEMVRLNFRSEEQRTLYTQLMLAEGFLAGKDFYPTYSHRTQELLKFLKAADKVFGNMQYGTPTLSGPVAESGFSRLTA